MNWYLANWTDGSFIPRQKNKTPPEIMGGISSNLTLYNPVESTGEHREGE